MHVGAGSTACFGYLEENWLAYHNGLLGRLAYGLELSLEISTQTSTSNGSSPHGTRNIYKQRCEGEREW